MHELPKCSERSVYVLLTELCRDVASQNGLDECNGLKMRSEAYEILLRKATYDVRWNNCDTYAKDGKVHSNALRELEEYLFVTKLNAKTTGEYSSNLETQIHSLLSSAGSYFSTKEGNDVLRLLLALKSNVNDMEQQVPIKYHRELLVPAAFSLNAPYQNNRYYPKKYTILPKNAEPKYFKSLQKMQAFVKKSFVPQTFPKGVRNLLHLPTGKNTQLKNSVIFNDDSECTFTSMTRRHICSDADWLRIDMRSLQFDIQKSSDFYALQMSVISKKPSQVIRISDIQPIQTTTRAMELGKPKRLIERRRSMSWSWDQIGSKNGIQCPKPFVSDVNAPFELQEVVCQERKQKFEAKIVSKEDFLRDLKLLTVGLQSDIFYHDKEMIFCALPNITVTNILPATMANYVHEFLKCGTCYKRLHMMTYKRDHKHIYDGFIFKAFSAAVDEYLLTFRQFVFSYKGEETLMFFYKRMKQAMTQIQNLSLFLGVSPRVDPNTVLPKGSEFLGYIYREIMRVTDNEFITLLMFLLKRCCHVYFKYLQLWIFHGELDDPSKELFILHIDHYRKNTKHFYDKAYIVRKEAVPGFFQNYEDRILQCGKYTMLLKAYDANHPLFDLECPKIAVRLSFEEIQKLEDSCSKYAEKAREVCGKPVTVKDIFQARAKRRNDFQNLVFQRTRENIERWNLEQISISKKKSEEKRKRWEELSAQLEEAKRYQIDKRRESVEIELRALREEQKLNEEHMKEENINLRKRIEYYQELSDNLNSDSSVETQSKFLRRTRRHSFLSECDSPSVTPTNSIYSFSTALETFRQSKETDYISFSTENNTQEFEAEFAKTAEELHIYLEERKKAYDNNNYFNGSVVEQEREKPRREKLLLHEKGSSLPRSISDVINSNLLHKELTGLSITNVKSENALQLNRLKTLTGTIGLCLNEERNTKEFLGNRTKSSEILRVTFRNDVPSKKIFSEALTELELNKQKVLTTNDALLSHLHKDGSYRKSLPDINLNLLSENSLTDLERNRKHMMEAKFFNPSLSEKVFEITSSNKPLTELEQNRRKVLTEEYAVVEENKSEQPDVDIHTLPDDMLSDMQRNRRRMMESPHPFTEYNKPALSERPLLNLNLNTDRARNRRRVLESEYNILTGDAVSSRDVLTPMSTTSDPPLTDQLSENEQKSDIVNGNLRINISNTHEDSEQPSAALTLPPTTPYEALTTAGVRARNEGFEFFQKENEEKEKTSFLNITGGSDETDTSFKDLKHISPYKWCRELVESKFKCPTRSSVFRLNLDSTSKVPASPKKNSITNFKIDSLSVITLTEFLQKSIIIPMNTHMDLVNGEVMRVLLQDLQLIDHFRSLRHYFFLMDGEFGSIICDGIIGRVESGDQPVKVLSYQMLHMILDTALNFSIQKDNNAENLSFIVSDIPPKFELNSPSVLNVLCLSYQVQWPLNLILNPETLEQYGNIFKYLLKVRRISWVLEKAFELLRQAAKQHGKQLLYSPQYLRTQQIRHKFYHFVHALQNHITATALQASWKLFKDDLIHAKSLEDIYRMHTHYIKRIMFLCMLNRSSSEFNNAIESIFRISLKFYNNLKSREFVLREGAKEFTHSRFSKMISEEDEFEKLLKYTIYLGNKIVRRGYQAEIGEFITLININKYYTTQTSCENTSKSAKTNDPS